MEIYTLRIEYKYDTFLSVEFKFYKTKDEMKQDRENIENGYKNSQDFYKASSASFNEMKLPFEDVKDMMTIQQYEKLFGRIVPPKSMDDNITITIPVSAASSFYEMLLTQRAVSMSFDYMHKFDKSENMLTPVIDDAIDQIDSKMTEYVEFNSRKADL